MAVANLDETEAIKAWVLRACGWKTRNIAARFDVDPRRLYEVWEEQEHKGTRFKGIRLFSRLLPNVAVPGRFEVHKPRYQRVVKPEKGQMTLEF